MHIVIAGYGRVGRSIASGFESAGHTVAIIDRDVAAFEDPDPVRGRKVTGEAFDRETLESAGIGRAGCFCATTSGDNSNFVSARIAKEHYGVGIVVARIYEPRRAVIYRDIGIDTISSVDWATGEFLARVPASESAPTQAAAVSAPPIPTARTGQPEAANILIVGGGKAGAYLAERLHKDHPVTLVELRSDKIERLRRRMPDVDVLHGDGCEPGVLERAGALDADFVAAATGDDEDNLVVSHLMKSIHGTATVVARINHPANEWLFTPAWGVDVPVGAAAGLYQAVSARCDLPLPAKE
jgi:Trk K+ transport system NAD-binding subunit